MSVKLSALDNWSSNFRATSMPKGSSLFESELNLSEGKLELCEGELNLRESEPQLCTWNKEPKKTFLNDTLAANQTCSVPLT